MTDDDLIQFADELDSDIARERASASPWRIAIIDDEPDVHEATELAVGDAEILGRPLMFLHAYSAREGRALLEREPDVAVILLDVVMEAPDAGLRMVEVIRHELGMEDVRIILRTGQPGYAPEIDAIRDFDINDYKTKSDLTRSKLYATLTAAIRSYQQINTISASRRGLEMILRASSRLMAIQGIHRFAEGAVTQLAALLQLNPEGLVCARLGPAGTQPDEATIVAAAGRFAGFLDAPLTSVDDERVREALARCFAERRNFVQAGETVLFFGSSIGQDMAVFLDVAVPLDPQAELLVEVFSNNIAACYDNVRLFSELNASAYLDNLSNLPNRVALAGLIDQARANEDTRERVVVLADIVGFSEVNRTFGHHVGDQLLVAFGERLIDRLGGHAVVARVGGDTFGLFGPADRIRPDVVEAAMSTPLSVDGRDLQVRVTLGVLHLDHTEGSGGDALKDANIALHEAKRMGQHVCHFNPEMLAGIHERARLLDALRQAFEDERLHVVFQPQVELATGRVVGLEALLRWQTDDREFVEPESFIPLAEQSGLIVVLGEWVLRVACREAAQLAREGWPLRMAINLSQAQMRSPRFIEMVDAAIADTGVDAQQIEVEITESMAMQAPEEVHAHVAQLRRRGIAVAIDDFGTGYTSLAHLEDLGVDRMKVDRAFIQRLTEENHQRSIASSLTQLAHHMSLHVCAEGVETQAQCDWLKKLGVEEGQGWLFGRPMTADALRDWLANHPAR